MGDLFDELIKQESDIIIDENMLHPIYVPERILERDEQIEQIVPTLRVVAKSQVPRHLYLFGSNGTGKTVTVRYLLRRLHDYAEFRDVYIFGSKSTTAYSVMKEIALECGCLTTEKDLPLHDMRRMVQDMIRASHNPVIIVLDECDYLKTSTYEEILQTLIGDDRSDSPHVCVISIANTVRILSELDDPKVVSRYNPRNVEFPAYTGGELNDILRDRETAFYPGAIDELTIPFCAQTAVKNRNADARYALDLLSEAAEVARLSGEKLVTIECAKKAEQKLETDYSLRPIVRLTDKMRWIFLVIALEEEQRIRDVVKRYNADAKKHGEKPLRESNIGYYLGVLERRGLIERGRRGKEGDRGVDWFVWVSPNLNREEILKAYEVDG